MSLGTWKHEFYPTPASRCKKADALAHVLRKYLGTRKRAMKRHSVEIKRNAVTDGKSELLFNHTTCAFCKFYCKGDRCSPECPLVVSPKEDCFTKTSSYQVWWRTGDPEPMIRALRRAIKKQAAAKKETP